MRSKLVQGTKSITCEKRVRPEYMTVPRLRSQNRVRNYRQNPKPCSSRHQKKHPRNPYIAALFYKITLAEPDSTVVDRYIQFPIAAAEPAGSLAGQLKVKGIAPRRAVDLNE